MDETIKTILIVLAGMAPGIIALYANRKKTTAEAEREEADAAGKIKQAALDLIEPYQQQLATYIQEVDTLRHEVRTLRHEKYELTCGIDRLIAQMEASGLVPVWRPEKSCDEDVPTRPIPKRKGDKP